MSVAKIWHPFDSWEEFHQGMWRKIPAQYRKQNLAWAIKFTGDHKLYGSWMRVVLKEWPISCEHNLSDTGQNRRAWIGHAAVLLALDIPEDITREAWGHLTKKQQDLADNEANKAIGIWEKHHERKTRKIHKQVGFPGLSLRDSRRGPCQVRGIGNGPVIPKYLQGNIEKRHSVNQLGLF